MTTPGPLERFHRCLPPLLVHEGGFSNHPKDPGGATNKGVTQRVYDLWRRSHGLAPRSVAWIDDAEVEKIYHGDYWTPARCDQLPAGVDYAVFDCAVNQGLGRAARLLQEAVGVEVDAKVGPKTLNAVKAMNPHDLVREFCALREAHYRSLKTFNVFGRGWLKRLQAVRDMAWAWADHA